MSKVIIISFVILLSAFETEQILEWQILMKLNLYGHRTWTKNLAILSLLRQLQD